MTNLPLSLPLGSGWTPDQLSVREAFLQTLNDMTIRQNMENAAGEELFMEARDRSGNPKVALNLAGFLGLITKFLPTILNLLPAIIGLFTGGGFSVPAVVAIIQGLLSAFGGGTTTTP